MCSTWPTGNDTPLCMATPKSEPAATTGTSGACSQNILSDVRARGQSCTSSNTTSVSGSPAATPDSADTASSKRRGLKLPSNTDCKPALSWKVTYAVRSKQRRPNSCASQVFPTWRAPSKMSGLRRGFAFQTASDSSNVRCMAPPDGVEGRAAANSKWWHHIPKIMRNNVESIITPDFRRLSHFQGLIFGLSDENQVL